MEQSGRLKRFEDPNDDFPFYDGRPAGIAGRGWALLVGAVIAGFLVLFLAPFPTVFNQVITVALPLGALAFVAPGNLGALFRRVRGRDLALMVGFALLNLAVSGVVALVVGLVFGANANAVAAQLSQDTGSGLALFFFGTGVQLFGEELFTILPFLAVVHLFYSRAGLPRGGSVVIAWLLSALLFGLLHLPAYDWNLVQSVVVIGSARLVLTLAYIKTKNIWVSYGAHLINDWSIFVVLILFL
jgi:uncharacterized protein